MNPSEALAIAMCSVVEEMGCKQPERGATLASMGVDSMDFLSILLNAEKKSGFPIPESARAGINTIDDLGYSIWKCCQ